MVHNYELDYVLTLEAGSVRLLLLACKIPVARRARRL